MGTGLVGSEYGRLYGVAETRFFGKYRSDAPYCSMFALANALIDRQARQCLQIPGHTGVKPAARTGARTFGEFAVLVAEQLSKPGGQLLRSGYAPVSKASTFIAAVSCMCGRTCEYTSSVNATDA